SDALICSLKGCLSLCPRSRTSWGCVLKAARRPVGRPRARVLLLRRWGKLRHSGKMRAGAMHFPRHLCCTGTAKLCPGLRSHKLWKARGGEVPCVMHSVSATETPPAPGVCPPLPLVGWRHSSLPVRCQLSP
uniref:Uncharacterized protein n=1 Tax=Apteryx owenii TaxID=8824 RepID=A0A8B9QN89_APTOW